jgi:hypothetical protein
VEKPHAQLGQALIQREQRGIVDQESGADRGERRAGSGQAKAAGRGKARASLMANCPVGVSIEPFIPHGPEKSSP